MCQLLGCSNENLSGALTQQAIEVKREWVKTDFTEAWSNYIIMLSIYCHRGVRSLSVTRLF